MPTDEYTNDTREIYLEEEGDPGAEYHIKNQPGQLQREYVTDRDNKMLIQCTLSAVIHGNLDSKSEAPGTLIVFDFRFFPRVHGQRFTRVDISVLFEDEKRSERYCPEVKAIAPDDYFIMQATTKKQEIKRLAEAGIDGGSTAPVHAGFSYEITESIEKPYSIKVIGAIRFWKGNGRNKVEWTLLENTSQQSGVPTFLRAAILLSRKHNSSRRFIATVEIKAQSNRLLGIGNKLRGLTGRIPKDDPIIFSSSEPPTTNIFDATNLASQSLKDIMVVQSSKAMPDAIDANGNTSIQLDKVAET
ncbi:MAG: hypothetical protein M1834_004743 [Cirrosporium novae-zelandiae]|nr:MAG: hypothetical protein M1834_004743 [Cirrosporium novae-zelandiae]